MPGFFLVFFALLLTTTTTTAYQAKLVSSLLKTKQTTVDKLAMVAPGSSEMTRLRFALAFPSQAEATRALKATVSETMPSAEVLYFFLPPSPPPLTTSVPPSLQIAWRAGPGKSIVEAASKAVVEATRNPGEWDNEPVRLAAPHAKTINQFITPKNILTLSSGDGDLVYIIRASAINDGQLMRKVSVKQLSEFFAYVKEVHSIVANARSERTGRLCEVIFANDISGIRLPPNSKFSEALTSSSKQYEQLYPSLAGPTMILNLPLILQAFIALFKPLFPKSVQDRLLFGKKK